MKIRQKEKKHCAVVINKDKELAGESKQKGFQRNPLETCNTSQWVKTEHCHSTGLS